MTTPIDLAGLRALAENADLWQWEKQYFQRWTKPLNDTTSLYIAAFNPEVAKQLLDALERALAVTEPFAGDDRNVNFASAHDGGSNNILIAVKPADLLALADWRNGIIKERA